jgi:hypothetical protein
MVKRPCLWYKWMLEDKLQLLHIKRDMLSLIPQLEGKNFFKRKLGRNHKGTV